MTAVINKLEGCVFCELYELGDAVYETENLWMRFNYFPIAPGHAQIIPKRHVKYRDQLTDEENNELSFIEKKAVELILRRKYLQKYTDLIRNPIEMLDNKGKKDGGKKCLEYCKKARKNSLNLSFNQRDILKSNRGWDIGECAGQIIPHANYSIIPRFEGDCPGRGGIGEVIPVKRNHKIMGWCMGKT